MTASLTITPINRNYPAFEVQIGSVVKVWKDTYFAVGIVDDLDTDTDAWGQVSLATGGWFFLNGNMNIDPDWRIVALATKEEADTLPPY